MDPHAMHDHSGKHSSLGDLLVVCALMFLGAMICGALPFFMHIREAQLQTVSALGGGLLIGSALAVIVPEGFHSFAEASHEAAHEGHDYASHGLPHGVTGLALVIGFLAMLLMDQLQASAGGHHHHHQLHRHSSDGVPDSPAALPVDGHSGQPQAHPPKHALAVEAPPFLPPSDSAPALGAAKRTGSGASAAAAAAAATPDRAITGLLIHCAADGLAMGAAALSGNAALNMVVGTAMVLHKAPMAFGLATFLMSCHWGWAQAQRTLALFSATAPAAAVATYVLLGAVPLFTTPPAVALAMLFSGGTFLYAATMHILPEVLEGNGRLSREQLAAVAAGCLLPVALSWGHSH